MPTLIGRFFFAALIAGVCVPGLASAQVVITEIMYDLQSGADGGREWIEVYNAGTTTVSLNAWKLFENGTAHTVRTVFGGGTLAAGSYAVIADNAAKFKADWPQFTGQLFDSTFSLSNEGETIALRNASSTDIDTASYQSSMGAMGDGNSLNRANVGASFIPRSPSPGSAMSVTSIQPPPPQDASARRSPPPKEVVVKTPKTKKSTSKKKTSVPIIPVNENVVETLPEDLVIDSRATSTEIAVAAAASSGTFSWWLGALGIATFAAGSLFVARRFGMREWTIVDDSVEGDVEEKGG